VTDECEQMSKLEERKTRTTKERVDTAVNIQGDSSPIEPAKQQMRQFKTESFH
jgi:hypothetical protein